MSQRLKILTLFCALTLWGCSTVAPPGPPADPVERLRNDIDSILSDSIFVHTRTSMKVVSLRTGEVVYERDSKILTRPASNLKLLTTAAALHELGHDFRFRTLIFVDSLQADGIVHGNLYIKGFGDPELRTADLDSVALRVKAMGILQISGDIIGDNTYFDDQIWGNGWMWDDEPDPDEMFISALSVNKNCVTIFAAPTAMPGNSVLVACEPPTPYVSIQNTARTVRDSVVVPLKISRLFKERLNTITIRGEIRQGENIQQHRLSVWQPELYAAQLLKETLQRNGIVVFGQPGIGLTPATAQQLCERDWPLDSVVVAMNKISDNLSAENILKTLGAQKRGLPGTARNGISVVNGFLSTLGIDTTTHYIADGSGVSHYNLLTVDELVTLLVVVAKKPDIFPVLYASLPIAGVDGTLQNRMIGTAATGNLHGKTGTLSGVSSMSGYVTTQDGEMLAFGMLMQNFVLPTRLFQLDQDKIGAVLARFSRRRVVAGSH